MAYDAMAGYIYHLDTDVFAETTPEAYRSFLEVLEQSGVDTDTLAYALDSDDFSDMDPDADVDTLVEAYKNFREIFEARTGLKVTLTMIESGSEYNDVVGPVWHVLNAVEPTAPAKEYERFIQQKFFCHFG